MKTNFKIKMFSEIVYEGQGIDLHNNFNFISFEYALDQQKLILNWKRSEGDWVKEDEYPHITLLHTHVDYLQILTGPEENEVKQYSCLETVSFFSSNERDVNDCLLDQEEPGQNDDLIYTFVGDMIIRVGCKEAKVIL